MLYINIAVFDISVLGNSAIVKCKHADKNNSWYLQIYDPCM